MEQVIWKPVVGFEDRYVVSNEGEVKSLDIYVNYRYGKRLYKGRVKPTRKNNILKTCFQPKLSIP